MKNKKKSFFAQGLQALHLVHETNSLRKKKKKMKEVTNVAAKVKDMTKNDES